MRIKAFIILVVLIVSFNSMALAADVVLIINKANPMATVSNQDAQNIFLGKKTTWDTGKKIVLVDQQNQRVLDFFAKSIVKKSSQQYATYWKKALFTGTGIPPKAVDDDAEVKAFITGNKDAIGYISSAALDGSVKKLDLN